MAPRFSDFSDADDRHLIELYHIGHSANVAALVTWKAGDRVRVRSIDRMGIVAYVYTNGYTLVELPGEPIRGGILANDSTFGNTDIVPA